MQTQIKTFAEFLCCKRGNAPSSTGTNPDASARNWLSGGFQGLTNCPNDASFAAAPGDLHVVAWYGQLSPNRIHDIVICRRRWCVNQFDRERSNARDPTLDNDRLQ